MNLLDIIRRSRLLDPNIQLDNSEQQPIPPGIMNAGKPPDDLSSIPTDPIGQPKALPTDTSNEDNLLDLFRQNENHPALDAYKDYIAKPPTRDDPSTGRKIFAALAGFAGGASGTDPNAATDILDAPYKRKIEDYNLQGKGLAESAQLEHLTSTDKIKTFGEMRSEQKAERDHQDALRRADQADTKEERQRLRDEEMARHNSEMEKTAGRTAGASERRANAAEYKAEHPTPKTYTPQHIQNEQTGDDELWSMEDGPDGLQKGHIIGNGKLGENSRKVIDTSKVVQKSVDDIYDLLKDPSVSNEVGSALSGEKGSLNAVAKRLGASTNPKVSDLGVKLGLIEGQHLALLNIRGGPAGMEALDKIFNLGLGTNLPQMLGALKAVKQNAVDNFEVRVPGSVKSTGTPDLTPFKIVKKGGN